jgi:hypothetical protein
MFVALRACSWPSAVATDTDDRAVLGQVGCRIATDAGGWPGDDVRFAVMSPSGLKKLYAAAAGWKAAQDVAERDAGDLRLQVPPGSGS